MADEEHAMLVGGLSGVSAGTPSAADSEARQKFMHLVTKARKLTEEGDIARALRLNEQALAIHFSEKLQRRIAKMKAFLATQDENDDDGGESQMKSLGKGFMLHTKLHRKLYTHQKEGVLWMWSLFLRGKGGILADDMGLGKTIQVIGFLAGMFDMNKIKSVMIVVPLSVLPSWLNEFNKWTPGISVMQFHGSSKKERDRALNRVRTRGGVLMTTYGLVVTTKETFAERHGQEFVWDYVILDEGHKIKNPTKTSKSIHHIPARHRLILTGTPVQNNLKELWSLFDYVHQGSLLGTMRTFKMEFETPIIRARERDATAVEKKLGQEMAQTLKSIIQPYFLRRTKAEVSDGKNDNHEDDAKMPTMTRKNDLVIWLHLTETQQKIYQDFINLDQVKELLMTKKSPLVALTVLKKICDHPRLLSTRACLQLGLDGDNFDEEDLEQPESYESAATQIDKIPDEVLIQESGKMQILVSLLDAFKHEGHRTLVFSQSRKLLNIIQKVITNRGHKVVRLDGTVTRLSDREEIVRKFQTDSSVSVFLLTVQVGGVGLTITSADRVIIYDPNWNPATDAQAVDRAYRIGQDKNVVVYRLITCGTVEEKIYRRQVFKDSITRQTTGSNKNPYRYFTKMELRELFTLDDPRFSKTQRQLQDLHGNQRETDMALDEHIAFLHSLDIFGISDHDLMFKQTSVRDDEDEEIIVVEDEEQSSEQFIQSKVMRAQILLEEENNGGISYEERTSRVKKYPPSNFPSTAGKPSQLFTHIPESVFEEENKDKSSNNYLPPPPPSQETIDLTGSDCESPEVDEDVKIKVSPRATCSPLTQEIERRVLQPLTQEEVRQRSPRTPSATSAEKVMVEELLISPDTQSPIISLEKMSHHQKVLEKASGSSPSKLGQESPRSHLSRGVMPPFRNSRPSQRGGQDLDKMVSSRPEIGYSLEKAYPGGAASTPQPVQSVEILAEDTPGSSNKSSIPGGTASSYDSGSQLDVSHVSRKLSFVVEDSADDSDQSFEKNVEESPCPVARKKHKPHTDSPLNLYVVDSATCPTQHSISRTVCGDDDGSHRISVSESAEKADSCDKVCQMSRSLHEVVNECGQSPCKSLPGAESPSKAVSNKRRSVCLHKSVIDESSDDDGDVEQQSSESRDCSDEDSGTGGINEEEEEDKENDPVLVRCSGGRQRIVSDCESGEDLSCFEVEESDEDEDRQYRSVHSAGNSMRVTESDPNKQDESQTVSRMEQEDAVEDREDDDDDEELNERFQNLISVARSMYKQKNYTESLMYVEEALSIFQEPGLQEMADKIRMRIQAQFH